MAANADSTREDANLLLQSCLPLPLQDLCLLKVVNDVNGYPVDLLASLPRWLRYRLLNNLPALDLCRLERSAIAEDIDPRELWSSRWENPRIPQSLYLPPLSNTIRSDFHYRIKDAEFLQYLEPELLTAFQQLSNKDKFDPKQMYLLQVASDVLDSLEFETDVRALTIVPSDWLVSMKGDRLLQDLTEAKHNPHQARSRITYVDTFSHSYRHHHPGSNSRTSSVADCYKVIWGSQTTALARYEQDDVRLAPHRLLPIRERGDPIELLTLLVRECGLRPLSIASLGLTRMTNSKQWRQCMEEREKLDSILRHVLSRVSILGMQCDHVGQMEGVVQTVLGAILTDREQCRLRYLYSRHVTREFVMCLSPHFYVLPTDSTVVPQSAEPSYQCLSVLQLGVSDLEPSLHIAAILEQQPQLKCVQLEFNCGRGELEARSDVVRLFSTLSSLFLRPQFHFLKLELKSECTVAPSLLQVLLSGFMKAPCETGKQLTMTSESSDPTVIYQKEVELASVDLSSTAAATSAIAVPENGLQNKKLNLSSNLQNVVGSLLQLSTVRIRHIYFDCSHDSYPYLHQGALHPDLQVSSLSVQFQFCPFDQLLTNVESDLVTFFEKPALREVSLLGYWSRFIEIKAAVVKALHRRSKVGPLTKLVLTGPPTSDSKRHSKEEFGDLWKAIFSLPSLHQLEIMVGGDICNLTLENEELIYETWKEATLRTQIKTLKVVKYAGSENSEGHPMLSAVTRSMLFTKKPY